MGVPFLEELGGPDTDATGVAGDEDGSPGWNLSASVAS
jgi:hypothetical protein